MLSNVRAVTGATGRTRRIQLSQFVSSCAKERLFTGDRSRCFDDFARAEVAPAALCAFFEQAERWVHRVRMRRDFEHREVMQGIAEDGIWAGQADAAEGRGLGGARRNVDEFAGNDFVGDFDFGCKNAIFGDTEFANTFGDDPLVGGTDCPEFDVGLAQG